MIKKIIISFFISSAFTIIACSNEEAGNTATESNKEHFASDQKRALDKAKGVEQMLQDGADKREQQINDQTK
jgi:hypothetical protein